MENNTDEIDLVYVIRKLKRIVNHWIALLFKALDYTLKYKYLILFLIITGIVLGYLKNERSDNPQKAKLLVRVNYEMPNHVFNAIDVLNAKIRDRDSVFLNSIGISPNNPEIKSVEMNPVVNFNDILEKVEMNDRNLDMLLRNVDFEGEEIPLSDLFIPEYNFFTLNITLTEKASKKNVDALLNYINNQNNLKKYTDESRKNLKAIIDHNTKSLEQIDDILSSYVAIDTSKPLEYLLFVDKDLNLSGLFGEKIKIQKENQKLKNEYLLSDEIVAPIGAIVLTVAERGFMAKKMLIYPIFLVMLFMFLSYSRYIFFYLKKIAKENS